MALSRKDITEIKKEIASFLSTIEDIEGYTFLNQLLDGLSYIMTGLYIDGVDEFSSLLNSFIKENFSLPKRQPTYAQGKLLIRLNDSGRDYLINLANEIGEENAIIEIPAQTEIQHYLIPEITYLTTDTIILSLSEQEKEVGIISVYPSAFYNTGENTLTKFKQDYSFTDFVDITNPYPILTGSEAETEEEYQERLKTYLQNLSRGTLLSIKNAIYNISVLNEQNVVEQVKRVYVYDTPEQRGKVFLLLDSGFRDGVNTISETLLNEVKKQIEGYVNETSGEIIEGFKPVGIKFIYQNYDFSVPVYFKIKIEFNFEDNPDYFIDDLTILKERLFYLGVDYINKSQSFLISSELIPLIQEEIKSFLTDTTLSFYVSVVFIDYVSGQEFNNYELPEIKMPDSTIMDSTRKYSYFKSPYSSIDDHIEFIFKT